MKKDRVQDLEINLLYMLTQSFDLILRDIEWRMAKLGVDEKGHKIAFKHEKKKQFGEYLNCIRDIVKLAHKAEDLNEKLTQDIYDVSAETNYTTIPIWQSEANELARLLLMYADKSTTEEAVNNIHSFMRSLPGEGIITEDVLKNFYLKKL